jgi:hypothetical protein
MSKFLKLIESNLPEVNIDLEMRTKRELQRFLIQHNISAVGRTFKNQIDIKLPSGAVVSLAITGVKQPEENQEEEVISPLIKAISEIEDTKSPGIKTAQDAINKKADELAKQLSK